MPFKKGMIPWNKKYTDDERKERKRIEARNYYDRKIRPIIQSRIWIRNIKTILLVLSRIKRCEICKQIYLPTRYYYLPHYEKSRYCSRRCQHIGQAIEFKDGRFEGNKNHFYGKRHKKSSIVKMLKSLPIRTGAKHHNWQGGKSFEKYDLNWTRTFKEQIRNRDGYKCQLCGVPEIECTRNLHIHHIDYDKKNMDKDNLVSLCMSCHFRTNYHRDVWTKYFTNKKERANDTMAW